MTISERHDKQVELRNHIRKFMYDLVNAAPSRESWVPGENINYDTDLCVIVYNKRKGLFGKWNSYELYIEIYDDLTSGLYLRKGRNDHEIQVMTPVDMFSYILNNCTLFTNSKGKMDNLKFPREKPTFPDLSSYKDVKVTLN